MDKLTIGDITFLLFVIPGFLVVWTYRYFSKSKKAGEFEYLGLSFVWGMILFSLIAALSYFIKSFQKFFQNDFGASLALITFAPFLGWFGSLIVPTKFFKKLTNWMKPENYKR